MIANATIHLLHSFFCQADVQSPHTWLVIPSKDSSKSALEWHSMAWFFDKLINFTLKSPHWFYWLLCYLLLVFTCCWTSSRLPQHKEADVTSGTASNILRSHRCLNPSLILKSPILNIESYENWSCQNDSFYCITFLGTFNLKVSFRELDSWVLAVFRSFMLQQSSCRLSASNLFRDPDDEAATCDAQISSSKEQLWSWCRQQSDCRAPKKVG